MARERPNNPSVVERYNAGLQLGKDGEYEAALHVLVPLAEEYPEESGFAYVIAVTCFLLRRYEDTVKWAKIATSLCPGRGDYSCTLFVGLRYTSRLREAAVEMKRGLEQDWNDDYAEHVKDMLLDLRKAGDNELFENFVTVLRHVRGHEIEVNLLLSELDEKQERE